MTHDNDLVRLFEGARLLEVPPSTFSMGRLRDPDFPQPRVQGLSARLYSLHELAVWLESRKASRS